MIAPVLVPNIRSKWSQRSLPLSMASTWASTPQRVEALCAASVERQDSARLSACGGFYEGLLPLTVICLVAGTSASTSQLPLYVLKAYDDRRGEHKAKVVICYRGGRGPQAHTRCRDCGSAIDGGAGAFSQLGD